MNLNWLAMNAHYSWIYRRVSGLQAIFIGKQNMLCKLANFSNYPTCAIIISIYHCRDCSIWTSVLGSLRVCLVIERMEQCSSSSIELIIHRLLLCLSISSSIIAHAQHYPFLCITQLILYCLRLSIVRSDIVAKKELVFEQSYWLIFGVRQNEANTEQNRKKIQIEIERYCVSVLLSLDEYLLPIFFLVIQQPICEW